MRAKGWHSLRGGMKATFQIDNVFVAKTTLYNEVEIVFRSAEKKQALSILVNKDELGKIIAQLQDIHSKMSTGNNGLLNY